MGEFGVRYHAVVYYDFFDGERIAFIQKTSEDPSNIVWLCDEHYPVTGSYYCIYDYKNPINIAIMHSSIFDDLTVAYMIGVTAGKLGYSIDDVPQCYTHVGLYIEGLPGIICANRYGVAFKDVNTQDVLCNRSARTWEGREEKSLYRVLEKMLSRIRDVYGANYDISNFI